jgi:hypothetical protein
VEQQKDGVLKEGGAQPEIAPFLRRGPSDATKPYARNPDAPSRPAATYPAPSVIPGLIPAFVPMLVLGFSRSGHPPKRKDAASGPA